MKRGQFQISFGMLFSIILIIAFVAVAIYVIMFFLKMKKCSEISLFVKDLQEKIDRAWSSEESDFLFTRSLPSGIKKVCFIDLSKAHGFYNVRLGSEAVVKTSVKIGPLKAGSGHFNRMLFLAITA